MKTVLNLEIPDIITTQFHDILIRASRKRGVNSKAGRMPALHNVFAKSVKILPGRYYYRY